MLCVLELFLRIKCGFTKVSYSTHFASLIRILNPEPTKQIKLTCFKNVSFNFKYYDALNRNEIRYKCI